MTGRTQPVIAHVILHSVSGKSVRDAARTLSHRNVHEFLPTRETLDTASRWSADLGFHVDLIADTHLSISGPLELFERVFHVRLTQRQEERAKPPYYVTTVSPEIPAQLSRVVETITFPRPLKYHVSPMPPVLPYYHLRVPDDIAGGMDALRAQASRITGAGVRLAIVDSGLMPEHPYYKDRGYNIQPVVADPRDPEPADNDSKGHGTAMAACALAVAPGASLTMYKVYSNYYSDAFAMAVMGGSDIISCSWETDFDHTLHLAINHAVSKGIVVVFSCGNKGPVGWPGCEPAVFSVGGAYIREDGGIEASDYASSGNDNANEPGRQVPDFCGIVGQNQKLLGRLIALPTPPGSEADVNGSIQGLDGTATDDGWVVESGTSAAASMVAGVAALVMEADPSTAGDPEAIRSRLKASCFDVTIGKSASGEPAGPGDDPATGSGLVQAYRAINGRTTRDDLRRRDEGGRTQMTKQECCAGKGGEIRAWLLMRVDHPLDAAAKLHSLALKQQWDPRWSIKRVDTVDHDKSNSLTVFPAPQDGHNLFVAVKAADESGLQNAFFTIEAYLQNVRFPQGHVLTSSTYLDWA